MITGIPLCFCSASNSDLEILANEFGLVSVRNREFWKILFTDFLKWKNLITYKMGENTITNVYVPYAQFKN